MTKNNLHEEKWSKFLRRVRLFKFVPFVDFVLAAGSLATGKLHENSDFDVIVGVKSGRIFTVRFMSVLTFGLFGWRRKKMTHGEEASDKICLSHFVTPQAYKLKPPYNAYWQELYESLVPVLGKEDKIDEFFKANDWMEPKRRYDTKAYGGNPFHLKQNDSFPKLLLGKTFSGGSGDWLETVLKDFQIKRIEKSLPKNLGYKPRVIYDDDELEFHPDTKRIEEMLKIKKSS